MSQQSLVELQNRILSMEAQLQRMQEQYPVRSGQGSQDQVRYGDYRTVTDSIPPMAPEVAEQERREGEKIQIDRRAAVAQQQEIPDFDPYAWGEAKEGQSAAGRRQEVVQIQKRRQDRKQAQQDQLVLNQSTMDIDSQPPDAQFAAAQAFADEHRVRVAQEQVGRPNVRPAQHPVPQEPLQPASLPQMPDPFDLPQRPEGEAGQRWDRQQRREAQRQQQQPYTQPPPYAVQPDTSTQIPQPPEWRDTPERLTRGPTQPQQAQQQTFYQAQTSFDSAAARQMQMLAGFVEAATRRIEELECWRESLIEE